jgi:hypothetical protein
MLWPLYSLGKKIAVPNEQEIGLANDTVGRCGEAK